MSAANVPAMYQVVPFGCDTCGHGTWAQAQAAAAEAEQGRKKKKKPDEKVSAEVAGELGEVHVDWTQPEFMRRGRDLFSKKHKDTVQSFYEFCRFKFDNQSGSDDLQYVENGPQYLAVCFVLFVDMCIEKVYKSTTMRTSWMETAFGRKRDSKLRDIAGKLQTDKKGFYHGLYECLCRSETSALEMDIQSGMLSADTTDTQKQELSRFLAALQRQIDKHINAYMANLINPADPEFVQKKKLIPGGRGRMSHDACQMLSKEMELSEGTWKAMGKTVGEGRNTPQTQNLIYGYVVKEQQPYVEDDLTDANRVKDLNCWLWNVFNYFLQKAYEARSWEMVKGGFSESRDKKYGTFASRFAAEQEELKKLAEEETNKERHHREKIKALSIQVTNAKEVADKLYKFAHSKAANNEDQLLLQKLVDKFWNSKAEKQIGTKIFWREKTEKEGIIRKFSADGDYMVINDQEIDIKVEVGDLQTNKVPAEKWRQVSPVNVIKEPTKTPADVAGPQLASPAYPAPNPSIEERHKQMKTELENEKRKYKLLTPEDLLSHQTKPTEQNMDLTARNGLREDYQSQLKKIKQRIFDTELELIMESDPGPQQVLQEHLSVLQKERADIIEKLSALLIPKKPFQVPQAHQQSAQARRDKLRDQILNLVLEKGRTTTTPSRRSEIDKELKKLREQGSKL